MLTFDIHDVDYHIPRYIPHQIKPKKNDYLSYKYINKFKGHNRNCVIHVGYDITPFLKTKHKKEKTMAIQLRMYKKLANKLNAGYILIHLPNSLKKLRNFKNGLELIDRMIVSDEIEPYNGIILLEITCFHLDLIEYLTDNYKINDYKVVIHNYFKEILPHIGAFGGRIKIILDTAHLYGNGCVTFELYMHTVNILGEHLADIIHLNGNVNETYTHDEHIPFIVFNDRNKIYKSFGEDGYNNLLRDVFARNKIVISENKFHKYPDITYDTYKEWCDKHNYKIIGSPSECKYALN